MKRALFLLFLIAMLIAGCHVAPAKVPAVSPQPTTQPGAAPTPAPAQRGDVNILLLGTDQRANGQDSSWRTDTVIIVAIRPQRGLVAMFSIPRDLWVDIPGYGKERINAADYFGETRNGTGGGPALVAATLEQNLGISVDSYVRIRFEGLQRVIDSVGGVTVHVERAFDEWMDEGDGTGRWHFQLDPGTQHMDGRTALHYARSRKDANDMDRSQRQQQVLLALREAAMRPEMLPRLPGLVQSLASTVQTDLSPSDALGLLGVALRVRPDSYRGRVFDYSMVTDWTTPDGAMVLLPNRVRIEQAWRDLTGSGA